MTNQETLVIWGGGGHAKVVLDAVRTHGSLIDRTVIVDDVIGVIKASIQLWPTLVEIAYFQKRRSGLSETLVANQRK